MGSEMCIRDSSNRESFKFPPPVPDRQYKDGEKDNSKHNR